MSNSNARSFLDAFARIEEVLAQQQERRENPKDWPSFSELLDASDTLLLSQKEHLRRYARLRNAISHNSYRDGAPIADPRTETVDSIERIQLNLEKPPLLIDQLKDRGTPHIYNLKDEVSEFLELVVSLSYSQAPVKALNGYELITTNAVARWFAKQLTQSVGAFSTATIEEVLNFAEAGDKLRIGSPTTTVVQAINIFAGQNSTTTEPPSAILLLGKMGQQPQRLCTRFDLTRLYASLQD